MRLSVVVSGMRLDFNFDWVYFSRNIRLSIVTKDRYRVSQKASHKPILRVRITLCRCPTFLARSRVNLLYYPYTSLLTALVAPLNNQASLSATSIAL
jgi:hypothetical protein